MTQEQAIELAKECAADCIRTGVVRPVPWYVVDRDSLAETGLVPAWVVHFEYVLAEGVAIQCPSSLTVEIDKQTAKATMIMGM